MTDSTPHVFLSYSRRDRDRAAWVYQHLIDSNVKVWWDEESLLPGQKWEYEIRNAIRSAFAVIICLSNSWVNERGYVQKELKLALDVLAEFPDNHIFLIPVKFGHCDVPDSLRDLHWIDLDAEGGLEKLQRSITLKGPTKGRADAIGRPRINVLVGVSESVKKQLIDAKQPIPEPVTATAIIDPTSNMTTVDPSLLQQLGLTPTNETIVVEIDGVINTQFFQVSLTLGDGKQTETVDLEVVGRPRVDYFEVIGALASIDKVAIGQDILKHFRFVLDGPKGTVSLS